MIKDVEILFYRYFSLQGEEEKAKILIYRIPLPFPPPPGTVRA